MYNSSSEARSKGWHSRRHQSSDAHFEATRAYRARKQEKLDNARQRAEAAAVRTPQEKLRLLDERLEVGIGAKRERERLLALIV